MHKLLFRVNRRVLFVQSLVEPAAPTLTLLREPNANKKKVGLWAYLKILVCAFCCWYTISVSNQKRVDRWKLHLWLHFLYGLTLKSDFFQGANNYNLQHIVVLHTFTAALLEDLRFIAKNGCLLNFKILRHPVRPRVWNKMCFYNSFYFLSSANLEFIPW